MQILIAKYAGFCGGVKRAIDLVEQELAAKGKNPIKILGELVHNRQVMERFRQHGVKTITDLRNLQANDRVIIRAHGVPEKIFRELWQKGVNLVNATCPKVEKTQHLVRNLEKKGYQVIIFGDPKHAEVQALLGYLRKGRAIANYNDAKKIPPTEKIALVAQSTSRQERFPEIIQLLEKKCDELLVKPTFCAFTLQAQKEAEKLARQVDLMLVIGGRHSANTKRLFEKSLPHTITHHIETAAEIRIRWFKNVRALGITAGASTPPEVINEVMTRVEGIAEVME